MRHTHRMVRSALVALRDCGPMLVRFDHPGFIALYETGMADSVPFGDDENALVYRLTDLGRQAIRGA